MKAEDTVMNAKDVDWLQRNDIDKVGYYTILDELKAQAEISFKAGQEAERQKLNYCEKHKLYYCDCCPDCFEEKGIREVVEWIESRYGLQIAAGSVAEQEWQAKLKAWGINEALHYKTHKC